MYRPDHYDGKGAFGEYLRTQDSKLGDGLTWTNILTGPYMEMLRYVIIPFLLITKH